eukprot:CAMPEP_0117447412 /NCGR_PEP_ID=MMETSP0759-20121206/6862_1 /TAXON_ID=63605 /ORGANISM="Percolomonas cosmopolitus, Strain WS" /LENGTH=304 /DNA_ID=CAMNT_0005239747 /DNA_START=369 /DNA_END=1283 /DNA_ORIENTATION=+
MRRNVSFRTSPSSSTRAPHTSYNGSTLGLRPQAPSFQPQFANSGTQSSSGTSSLQQFQYQQAQQRMQQQKQFLMYQQQQISASVHYNSMNLSQETVPLQSRSTRPSQFMPQQQYRHPVSSMAPSLLRTESHFQQVSTSGPVSNEQKNAPRGDSLVTPFSNLRLSRSDSRELTIQTPHGKEKKEFLSMPQIEIVRASPTEHPGSAGTASASTRPTVSKEESMQKNHGTPFESQRLPTPTLDADSEAPKLLSQKGDFKFCGYCKKVEKFSNTQARKPDGKCKKCIYAAMRTTKKSDSSQNLQLPGM